MTFWNNIAYAAWVVMTLCYLCENLSQFLFSFRYFEVAEMLGRRDKSNEAHLMARRITGKVSIVAVIVIILQSVTLLVNKFFAIYHPDMYSKTLNHVCFFVLPNAFIFIDCTLLLIALVWIFKSLKHDKHVMGNEKYMLLHTFLLTLLFGSQLYTAITFEET